MTLSLIKPGGWGVNEKLTSGQITDLDANVVMALDKTSTDTITGAVTVDPAGSITFGGMSRAKVASRSKTRQVQTSPTIYTENGAGVVPGFVVRTSLPRDGGYRQNSILSGYEMRWPLKIKDGSTLTGIHIYVTGSGHVAIPSGRPRISLASYTRSTGVYDQFVQTSTMNSGVLAHYNSRYGVGLTLPPFSIQIDSDDVSYYIEFRGEHGSDTAVLDVWDPYYTATYTEYDET